MNKNKKEKFAQGFKMYNYVMQEIWKLLTTLLFGVLAGYLLRKNGPTDNNYFVISIIVSLFIGLINFFVGLLRIIKREEQRKKKQQEHNENQEL